MHEMFLNIGSLNSLESRNIFLTIYKSLFKSKNIFLCQCFNFLIEERVNYKTDIDVRQSSL